MLVKMIEMVFQDLFLLYSERYAKFFFGFEIFASIITIIFLLVTTSEFIVLVSVVYPIWIITKYYDTQRKRIESYNLKWVPTKFAKSMALIHLISFTLVFTPFFAWLTISAFIDPKALPQWWMKWAMLGLTIALPIYSCIGIRKLKSTGWPSGMIV